MIEKIKKFTLKKENAFFSDKQKRNLEMHIDFDHNWRNFKDLESIRLLTIDDNSFVVRVFETGESWHSSFSRILNEKAMLGNLCIVLKNDRQLFNVQEEAQIK
ncbi:hypothetical protein [Fictibacillus halophilus]|uniref:hypothetical protein n=1 Tax=Fictibacillus halophilus TaxID=1610490 RepID=UPI001CFA85D0|nr:hypothetical protein [Fictibacillus halophilus]